MNRNIDSVPGQQALPLLKATSILPAYQPLGTLPTQPWLQAKAHKSNRSSQALSTTSSSSSPPASPAASSSPSASPVDSPVPSSPSTSRDGGLPGWALGLITFLIALPVMTFAFLLQKGSSPTNSTSENPTNASSQQPQVQKKSLSKKPPPRTLQPAKNGHRAAEASTASANQSHSIEKIDETTRLPRVSVIDQLTHDLCSADPVKRQKAIWELGQRGDTRAVQPLVELMVNSDSKQRSLILASLSEIGTRTLKPLSRALAISLQDNNAEVRKNAIRDLTRVYDLVAQISQLLHHATEDPDQEVRETARWALGQLNRIRTVPSINLSATYQDVVSPPENIPGETLR
ncbi:MAG: HEAT repeat domain-containing protein [Scytolyngbya sp. HA4215-MV1]|nr:HEAT repeat domain-containing protein [Scytolyngbya sp. HA4215-MV1]